MRWQTCQSPGGCGNDSTFGGNKMPLLGLRAWCFVCIAVLVEDFSFPSAQVASQPVHTLPRILSQEESTCAAGED